MRLCCCVQSFSIQSSASRCSLSLRSRSARTGSSLAYQVISLPSPPLSLPYAPSTASLSHVLVAEQELMSIFRVADAEMRRTYRQRPDTFLGGFLPAGPNESVLGVRAVGG